MNNIPPIPKIDIQNIEPSIVAESSMHQPQIPSNVIPVDVAKDFIKTTFSELIPLFKSQPAVSTSPSVAGTAEGLGVMDKKGVVVSQVEYERLMRDARERVSGEGNPNTLSLGTRFERTLNDKINDEVITKMVGSIFSTGNGAAVKKHSGMIGAAFDLLDTKFGYGLGETLGNNATKLIESIGKERIQGLVDAYNMKDMTPEQIQQMKEQEGLKQQEQEQAQRVEQAKVILSLDENNPEHLAKFASLIGITNPDRARNTLVLMKEDLAEQFNIQLPRTPGSESQQPKKKQRQEQSQDLNRQLIEQYENEDSGTNSNIRTRGAGGTFFDSPQQSQSPVHQEPFGVTNSETNTKEDEFVLSLNPDDPISQQQFMAYRNISGVDLDIVKKMMIKEQKKYRETLSNPEKFQQEHHPTISSINDGRGWDNSEIGKVPVQQTIPNEQSIQQSTQQQTQQQNSDISAIASLIDKLGQNFEKSVSTLSEKIAFLEQKIASLENPPVTEAEFKEVKDEILDETNKSEIEKVEDNISEEQSGINKEETDILNIPEGGIESVENINTGDISDIHETEDENEENEEDNSSENNKNKKTFLNELSELKLSEEEPPPETEEQIKNAIQEIKEEKVEPKKRIFILKRGK